ncbi:auxin-responsive protein SAUR36 [Cinnamomum micranthum f. kanehirae]|uniref:Auxin-responsive protein SAUR36 n=1 Tax=Cinnamomum micranthum f. kanehirae TaxID=337451 RepID=A0A3S3Q7A7_9MAGN|nr:auxin-responsive protein SAUR36 [Cinnamomum micranthum f. kanehirae]
MRKTRGFRLGRKVVKLWKWLLKPKRKPSTAGYLRLNTSNLTKTRTMTKICNWGRRLTQSLRPPLLRASSYSRIDQTPLDEKPVQVPKGHLAVYVGQKDGDPHRFLVPIIYFNHPLFGQLLREAEEEYGFHHPGGITIPCQISEFESVQMKIAGESCRRRRRSLLGRNAPIQKTKCTDPWIH